MMDNDIFLIGLMVENTVLLWMVITIIFSLL